MTFKGGESLFQNCESCLAPIVVPSDIFYERDAPLAYDNFASLNNDIEVNVEQVTNDLTFGDSLPTSSIADDTGFDVVIEKFDEYQQKLGGSTVEEKRLIDDIVTSGDEKSSIRSAFAGIDARSEQSASLDMIRGELREGDKVSAIKIYRETFGGDLKSAKEAVEELEREEFKLSEVDLELPE
jgi:hypothetical protein